MSEHTYTPYIPEKAVWTQDDYELMGWHDAHVHGFAIQHQEESWEHNLLIDIDYIFKWEKPVPPDQYFTFWVAPCTLVFKNAFAIRGGMDTNGGGIGTLEIADLVLVNKTEQEKNVFIYEWNIDFHFAADIKLKSYGFEQIVRQAPIHTVAQGLTNEERGGIGFGLIPYRV